MTDRTSPRMPRTSSGLALLRAIRALPSDSDEAIDAYLASPEAARQLRRAMRREADDLLAGVRKARGVTPR